MIPPGGHVSEYVQATADDAPFRDKTGGNALD